MWRVDSRFQLSVLLCLATVGQLVASVGMQWFAIVSLGAGVQTDALLAGMTLPLLCITLGVETLTFVLTPILSAQPEAVRRSYAWIVLIVSGMISVVVAGTLGLLAGQLTGFLVPGFGPEGRALTLTLTRIQLLTVIGAAAYAVLTGLCQARGQFLRPSFAALACLMAAWLVLVWRLPRDGVMLAAWMQVVVYVGPPLLLLPVVGPPRLAWRWPSELLQLWRTLRPLCLTAVYCRSGFIVDRCLASFAVPGGLVLLDFGQRLQGAAARVINEAVVTPEVPQLARTAAAHQWDSFHAIYIDQRRRVARASVTVGGLIATVSFMSHWWLGGIDPGSPLVDTVRRLVPVLGCLSGIAATASLTHTLTTAFCAMGDTATPSRIGARMYTVGVAMKLAGAAIGGLLGIAVAITISSVCNWLALEYAWSYKVGTPLERVA